MLVSEIEDQLDAPVLLGGQKELLEKGHAGEITNQQARRARVGASSKPGRGGNRFLPLGSLSEVDIGAGNYAEATVLPWVGAGFGTRLHREAVRSAAFDQNLCCTCVRAEHPGRAAVYARFRSEVVCG